VISEFERCSRATKEAWALAPQALVAVGDASRLSCCAGLDLVHYATVSFIGVVPWRTLYYTGSIVGLSNDLAAFFGAISFFVWRVFWGARFIVS
jgi:hypothetical protein